MSRQLSAISYQQVGGKKLAIVTRMLTEDIINLVLGAVSLAPLTADC